MRATASVLFSVLALAGCGGDDTQLPVSAPVPSPTPPPTSELKYDLLTAIDQLETYRFAEGLYTDDETLLGPAFPRSVTVKEAGPDGYYLAAYDAEGIRYAAIKEGEVIERTCDPPEPDACPDGEW